jgi:hypothetical protein
MFLRGLYFYQLFVLSFQQYKSTDFSRIKKNYTKHFLLTKLSFFNFLFSFLTSLLQLHILHRLRRKEIKLS